ncbi:MAG: ribonuclease J [Clostridia bacterium]|nr:ribonuclease J [Clostridia bacterium]
MSKSNKNNNSASVGKKKLNVVFMGGVGEIGKNMTLFEYGKSVVVLDCGLSFPTSDMPGIDVVIPDFGYLKTKREQIKGLILTHGHEDHIGAVSFFLKEFPKVPVFGTKLTLGLLQHKLIEHGITSATLKEVSDRTICQLGDFSAEFINVTHSVAGSLAVCLTCGAGKILHTGDFKIDYTPIGPETMNLGRFAELGKQGVLLLMADSTNVDHEGYTLSESVVAETMNKVFAENKGRRLIVATFASNIDRLGMIVDLAIKHKRKIAVSGKSMANALETAERIGYLALDRAQFIDINRVEDFDDGKICILATGTQGEPMSSLTRMASGEFNKVQVGENDTIVLSSSQIPGNERDVYNVINNLYRLGANVIYNKLEAIHSSGHACQEELKLIQSLVKPKYFIPVHGEYRHLKMHAQLAEEMGVRKKNIVLPEVGDSVTIDGSGIKVKAKVEAGAVLVDGLGIGDISDFVLKDRLTMSEDGILIIAVGVGKETRAILSGPELISRGCFTMGDESAVQMQEEIKALVRQQLDATPLLQSSIPALKQSLQKLVRKYVKANLKRYPLILPIILEM